MHTEFWWVNPRKGDHLEDLDVNGRMILKWISKRGRRDVDWIELDQDKCGRLAIVNAVMNLRVP